MSDRPIGGFSTSYPVCNGCNHQWERQHGGSWDWEYKDCLECRAKAAASVIAGSSPEFVQHPNCNYLGRLDAVCNKCGQYVVAPGKVSDLDALKRWCRWMRGKGDLNEQDALHVKATEDLISQVGTLKARLQEYADAATAAADSWKAERDALASRLDRAVAALKGVVRVADRKTAEFDAARAVIHEAEGLMGMSRTSVDTQAIHDEANMRHCFCRPGFGSPTTRYIEKREVNAFVQGALWMMYKLGVALDGRDSEEDQRPAVVQVREQAAGKAARTRGQDAKAGGDSQ